MNSERELIRSGLFFSDLWNIGFALFDLDNHYFYFLSREFSAFTGITNTTEEKKNPLQGVMSSQDFEITENILQFIRTEKASKQPNNLYELSFYINVRLLNPTEQFAHLTFNIKLEPESELFRPNTLTITCIPEQLFGYERFTLHNILTHKILYYSEKTKKFIKKQQLELNETEKRVLNYINNGLVDAKIATQLHTNINSIKYYKKSIFKKLHASTISEAIYIAIHCGII